MTDDIEIHSHGWGDPPDELEVDDTTDDTTDELDDLGAVDLSRTFLGTVPIPSDPDADHPVGLSRRLLAGR